MNTDQLKKYAPEARTRFIREVSAQAAKLGVTAKKIEAAKVQGDVLLIAGQAYPRSAEVPRNQLIATIKSKGFDVAMEAAAYTWFNRLVALRYMEIHGYLDHGYRVLSHPQDKPHPELLDYAADLDLPDLNKETAIELKLDGNKDEELYRLLLIAQCNVLHKAMPFLFDRVGGEAELLLPSNLLHTDSVIRQLVEQIDEELWQEIEIIGWLYQFYISEKKDEVIGKVVKSEDIPAATQLFTPNWIVKYMVQNSLGARWLATYPGSPLKAQMEYYIEPAEQTDEVNAQLEEITPSQLDPEALTLIDPACGSGHILVEAYDVFKAIYLERGYRQRDIPQLILKKNLFGLDIDERAGQLSGFALMMKGRADDRRLFDRGVALNVMAMVDSEAPDVDILGSALNVKMRIDLIPRVDLFPETDPQSSLSEEVDFLRSDVGVSDIEELIELFECATTFGSLIQVPEGVSEKLPALKQISEASSQDLFVSGALKRLGPLVQQAEMLAAHYDAVVANPPYMGAKLHNAALKKFLKVNYQRSKSDVYSAFIERSLLAASTRGVAALVTMHGWMFQSTFEEFRRLVLETTSIRCLAHLGARAFSEISGEVVQASISILLKRRIDTYLPTFSRLVDGEASSKRERLRTGSSQYCRFRQDRFTNITGCPIAYWLEPNLMDFLGLERHLGDVAFPKKGCDTGENEVFLRFWHEPDLLQIAFRESECSDGWYPYSKGGSFRRWYGNQEYIVDWRRDGASIRSRSNSTIRNEKFFFQKGLGWSDVATGRFSLRYFPEGFIMDAAGPMMFPKEHADLSVLLAFCNSPLFQAFLDVVMQGFHYSAGVLATAPFLPNKVDSDIVTNSVRRLVNASQADWDAYERSWDFQSLPLLTASFEPTPTLESNYTAWITQNRDTIAEMKRLEEENNRLFIDAYGLADELTPDVPIEQITLTVNPAYRYGKKVTEEEQWTRFRQDTMEELVSYGIGCMMGRYSLDAPGLIYAQSSNKDFDSGRYTTFPADDDGIIPLTDTEWFEDDAANRLIEFMSVAWPGNEESNHLEENLTFLANNLSPKKNESSRDTLRRYLCDKFFKDHLQTYKKRPIYWLFSSGKQKAFQCLIYLHRYNEGSLSRMRSEYVIPLQGKMASRVETLKADLDAATSTSHRKTVQKELTKLEAQQVELIAFDEKLRHVADQRITLDLDDGVKVNYGKFGDLLLK